MKVVLTIALFGVLAMLAVAPAMADPTGATGPVVTQCANGIDDDMDGGVDGGDPGCDDDSPDTEDFTGPILTLTSNEARSLAREAAEVRFESAYRNGLFEQLKCRRATRIKFMCGIGWYYGGYIYLARVKVFHFLDLEAEESSYGYTLRGWKLTLKCADRKRWQRCATKRYRL